jgi:hypothetical protein
LPKSCLKVPSKSDLPITGIDIIIFLFAISCVLIINFLNVFFYARFDTARQKISNKYDEIEHNLIEDFLKAHHNDDKRTMKRVAVTLSHFKVSNHY